MMQNDQNPFEKKRNWLFFLSKTRKQKTTNLKERKTLKSVLKTCDQCGTSYTLREWNDLLCVCKKCGKHHSITAYTRLHYLLDPETYQELPSPTVKVDPLSFPDYSEKLANLQTQTGLTDAVVCATGKINEMEGIFVVMDSRFLMGSMGNYVGEAVTQAIEYADQQGLPLIIFTASGGARMQEGIFSLMQMAKTSAAIGKFSKHGGFYISCLTHPTTGGVTASFASLGDITLAEPDALIGFAGPRVIEQTIRQKLPEGFQRSEYLMEHGFVDQVIPRNQFREVLSTLLRLYQKGSV